MVAAHYLLFIGASPSLSSELLRVSKRFENVRVVAPVPPKNSRGINEKSVSLGIRELVKRINNDRSFTETTRFSVWSYKPASVSQIDYIWSLFGRSGWLEFLPNTLERSDVGSRVHIEQCISRVLSSINVISTEVYSKRKNSPLNLPLKNFDSKITSELRVWWYNDLSHKELVDKIKKIGEKFRGSHKTGSAFKDDRNLIFSPAADGECHGMPHPTGEEDICFIAGRFRFGATLYPGFHYDVKSEKGGKINRVLYDCCGTERPMASENRAYINIFPNDHLLPKK